MTAMARPRGGWLTSLKAMRLQIAELQWLEETIGQPVTKRDYARIRPGNAKSIERSWNRLLLWLTANIPGYVVLGLEARSSVTRNPNGPDLNGNRTTSNFRTVSLLFHRSEIDDLFEKLFGLEPPAEEEEA